MKIIFCDNSLKETFNFRGDIIDHFLKNGNSIVLIAPNNLQKGKQIKESVKLYSPKLERSGMNPIKDFIYMMQLLKIYWQENPDIIFHYTIKPNIYGSIAAKICGIPSVAMVTGLGYAFFHRGLKTKIARILYKVSMKFPEKIFVLNEENMYSLVHMNIITKEKTVLLSGGEGINLEIFK